MMTNITALGDEVTTNSAGESIIVKNAKREYLKKFGYVKAGLRTRTIQATGRGPCERSALFRAAFPSGATARY